MNLKLTSLAAVLCTGLAACAPLTEKSQESSATVQIPSPMTSFLTQKKSDPQLLPGSVTVLMYHILDAQGPRSTSVSPRLLRSQLNFLQQHTESYPVVSAKEALSIVQQLAQGAAHDNTKTAVLFTVDDGWKNATLFSSELASRGWRGVLFEVSGMMKAGCCMSPNDLIHVQKQGLDVGNHTHSHSAKISSAGGAVLTDDVQKAQTEIHQVIGHTPTYFAYPYGLAPAGARKSINDFKFDAVFGTHSGRWTSTTQNQMVPRYSVAGAGAQKAFSMALGLSASEFEQLQSLYQAQE